MRSARSAILHKLTIAVTGKYILFPGQTLTHRIALFEAELTPATLTYHASPTTAENARPLQEGEGQVDAAKPVGMARLVVKFVGALDN